MIRLCRTAVVASVMIVSACATTRSKSPVASVAAPPVRDFQVASGSVSLRARVVGDGPATVIVVHGGPGLSHRYVAAFERLAALGLRVVLYDQRGSGGSSAPGDGSYAPADYVADLEAVRQSIGADRVHIIGHSWGGFVAMSYAIAHPEHTASLLLVDSMPARDSDLERGMERFGARQRELTAAGVIPEKPPHGQGNDCGPYVGAILPSYFADPRAPVAHDASQMECSWAPQAPSWKAVQHYDLGAALHGLAMPALVVFGDRDPFGLEWADDLIAALPSGTTKLIVANAGHMPWMEAPGIFWPGLERFLARVTSAR